MDKDFNVKELALCYLKEDDNDKDEGCVVKEGECS
jgi:hypothetical protein